MPLAKNKLTLATELLQSYPRLDEEELAAKFVGHGFNLEEARRLIAFLPLAFGRVLLRRMGARVQSTYMRTAPNGAAVERRLDKNEFWREISDFVDEQVIRGLSGGDLLLLAGRSAEFDAVNQLLNQGSDARAIVLSPPVFSWIDESDDESLDNRN